MRRAACRAGAGRAPGKCHSSGGTRAATASVARARRALGRLRAVQNFEPARTAAPEAARDGLPAPRRFWAMAAIILGITLSVLDSTIVNLALPDIARDFGATPSAAIWVVN